MRALVYSCPAPRLSRRHLPVLVGVLLLTLVALYRSSLTGPPAPPPARPHARDILTKPPPAQHSPRHAHSASQDTKQHGDGNGNGNERGDGNGNGNEHENEDRLAWSGDAENRHTNVRAIHKLLTAQEEQEEQEEEEEEEEGEEEEQFDAAPPMNSVANFSTNFYGPFDLWESELPGIVSAWRQAYDKLIHTSFDALQMEPPRFLPEYRNPCFRRATGALRCAPHFMLIGVQKCGTTDLYDKMMIHPNISRARTKEPFWWNRGRFKGKSWLSYLDLFEAASQKIARISDRRDNATFFPAVTGEGSAGTLWDSHNWMSYPQNRNTTSPVILTQHVIRHVLPATRFIVILREPVSRLYSDYNFFNNFRSAKYTASPQDFHNRVKYAISWLQQCFAAIHRRHCLFDPPSRDLSLISPAYYIGSFWNPVARLRLGLYSEYLAEWRAVFPPEQTLVLRMEDYSADRLATLNAIFTHVGLDALPEEYAARLDDMGTKNVQKKVKPEPMLDATRDMLRQFYAPYNSRLAAALGDDRFLWAS